MNEIDKKRYEVFIAHLQEQVSRLVDDISFCIDCPVLLTSVKENYTLIEKLRNDHRYSFKQLIDITAVDYPGRMKRFELVYHLLNIEDNLRLRIKMPLAEEENPLSIVSLYPAAGWFEREVWDLFGIFFEGNPDMRRILSDYGFQGHPLRKDFPLSGHVEVRYDAIAKRVIYEPVKLTQAFRSFDFESPWEGVAAPAITSNKEANA